MKKTAFTLAAALTLALCGCENKTVTDSPAPEQPTEPAEPVFAEYTEEDFTPIKMNLNITDDPPPFEIHSADLSGLDFGERLSPCKAEDVREKYDPSGIVEFDDPERQAEYDAERERFYNTPSKGRIESIAYLNGKFYFSVNYDDLCYGHDSSIFSFDPETGEQKELVTRTGLEYDGFRNFISAGGRLIFIEYGDDSFAVCNIDPDNGEISELFTLGSDVYWIFPSPNGILAHTNNLNTDTTSILEYDIETGEVLGGLTDEEINANYGLLSCGGHPAAAKGGKDGEPLSVKTAYYSLETEHKRCTGVYLWEDKASFTTDESVNNYSNESRLYTYDFERMERTEINFNGFSVGMTQARDGFVDTVGSSSLSGSTSTAYYIAPQLGTAFRLAKSDSIWALESGGVCCFLASENKPIETSFMVSDNYIPEKIYWFEV